MSKTIAELILGYARQGLTEGERERKQPRARTGKEVAAKKIEKEGKERLDKWRKQHLTMP